MKRSLFVVWASRCHGDSALIYWQILPHGAEPTLDLGELAEQRLTFAVYDGENEDAACELVLNACTSRDWTIAAMLTSLGRPSRASAKDTQ